MKLKLIALIALCNLFTVAFAQNDEKRIELELRDGYEDERVYPLNENGFLIQSIASDSKNGFADCKNDFYSTDFKLITSVSIPVKDKALYSTSFDEDGVNYTLLRNKRDYFAIITSDSRNQHCTKTEGKIPQFGVLSDMKVYGNKAIFKCAGKKESSILIVDLKSSKLKFVPVRISNFRPKSLKVLDYQVFTNEILVFVNAEKDKSNEDLYVMALNLDGQLKESYSITGGVKEKMITVAATKINNKFILTGTYSKNRSEMSQGIFIGELENKKLNYIKFYNFLELKNFTKYLSQKKQARIERKKKSKEKKGEEMILNYSIITHPLIENEDGYTFLGEAFYPTYRTYTTYMSNGRGGGTTMTYTVFDGFQYTHATLAKFDLKGKLVWDNTFAMWPLYKPFRIKKFVSLKQSGPGIELAFSEYNAVKYKVFDQQSGDIIKDNSKEVIETFDEGDKVKRTFSSIENWYDNNFIAYGIQTITNKETKKKRKVFFVNKVQINTGD